jgi:hypothetical protein
LSVSQLQNKLYWKLFFGAASPRQKTISNLKSNYSGLHKIAVSARASRGRKRLKSVVARGARHHMG